MIWPQGSTHKILHLILPQVNSKGKMKTGYLGKYKRKKERLQEEHQAFWRRIQDEQCNEAVSSLLMKRKEG